MIPETSPPSWKKGSSCEGDRAPSSLFSSVQFSFLTIFIEPAKDRLLDVGDFGENKEFSAFTGGTLDFVSVFSTLNLGFTSLKKSKTHFVFPLIVFYGKFSNG